MQAEVNRLLQLTSNMVIPIIEQVPQKVRVFPLISGTFFLSIEKIAKYFFFRSLKKFSIYQILRFLEVSRLPRRYLPAETAGYVAQNPAEAWIKGHNAPVPKISLDPAKRAKAEDPITVSFFSYFC